MDLLGMSLFCDVTSRERSGIQRYHDRIHNNKFVPSEGSESLVKSMCRKSSPVSRTSTEQNIQKLTREMFIFLAGSGFVLNRRAWGSTDPSRSHQEYWWQEIFEPFIHSSTSEFISIIPTNLPNTRR